MKLVVIESPFAADCEYEHAVNIAYVKACMLDCLRRGEAPIASHLIYPQVLDDQEPEERELGIQAGLRWGEKADIIAFYVDRGWSTGMKAALRHWQFLHRTIERRTLEAP